ncbi:MAG: rhomboid family intramembrane serine protease [Planctomycetota bacterium]
MPRETLNELWTAARSQAHGGIRKCPSCYHPMAEVPIDAGGLTEQVDVCTSCQFVWFDRGEFENLPKEASQNVEVESLPYEAREVLAKVHLEAIRKEQMGGQVLEDGPDYWWQFLVAIFGVPIVHNYTPLRHRPIATWSLAAIIAAVGIISFRDVESVVANWALIPAEASRYFGLTLFTSFFLHAGVLHLFGNLAFLIVFGRNTEDYLGRGRYLLLISAAVIGGASAHILSSPGSTIPCIGASGGISGVMAYYCLRFPKTRIGFVYWFQWSRVRADHLFVVWVLLQMATAFEASVGLSMIAAFAHLGGAAVGVLFWLATRQTFPESEEHTPRASQRGTS